MREKLDLHSPKRLHVIELYGKHHG